MSLSDLRPPGPRRFSVVGRAAIILWVAVMLLTTILANGSFVAPLGRLASQLGVGALSTWIFLFTGWRALRRFRRSEGGPSIDEPTAAFSHELGIGVGIVVALMFTLGVFGLFKTWAVVTLAVVLLAANPVPYLRELRERIRRLRHEGGTTFGMGLLAVVAVMTLLECLSPETSQDAMVYHLGVPDLYIRHGGFRYISGNFFSNFPQNVEMLFTLALLVEGSALAAFYHWLLGVGAVVAVAATSRRLSKGSGLLAAALFATIPSVALVATWAYVDLGQVLFQVLALLAFLDWWRCGSWKWLALAGVYTGLGGGCKYTGATIGVILGVAVFFEGAIRRRHFARSLASFFSFAAVALAVASPWFIKNIVYTGNPLYPFLYSVFGGHDWDPTRARLLGAFLNEWGAWTGAGELISLPWRLTFSARFFEMENFDGVIGPAFLVGLPLFFVALGRSSEFRLVAATVAGSVALWLSTTGQVRFLLPTLACLAALLAAGRGLLRPGLGRAVLTACLFGSCAFNALVIAVHFASYDPIPVVLGMETEDSFLGRKLSVGDYPVFRYIDDSLAEDAHILMAASGSPGFLCRRSYQMDPLFENRVLEEILSASDSPADVRRELVARGFTHLLFRPELVFDPKCVRSDLTLGQQVLLQLFLDAHCRLEFGQAGTLLYGLEDGR